jgi:hypothetical protein
MKSLYWEEPGQLAFRFNVAVFNTKMEIGLALPANSFFENQCFYPWWKFNYILE